MKQFNDLMKKEEEMMEKYGFVIHNVFPTKDDKDGKFTIHTHGLKKSFNHMDLEVVLPISPKIVAGIFHGMVDSIKEGETFEDKSTSDRVIQNFDVQLVRVNDGKRDLLRIVLPDENGKFPCDKDCADIYKSQLDDIIPNNKKSLN